MQDLIEPLLRQVRDSWKGDEGEDCAIKLLAFLNSTLPAYAQTFNASEREILEAMERGRTYTAINYYQRHTFPLPCDFTVFESLEHLRRVVPTNRFRCPACKQISTNPYECNSGHKLDTKSGKCDWKAYGLFHTLGKGLRFTLRDRFLENAKIDEIFMPVDLEPQPETATCEG